MGRKNIKLSLWEGEMRARTEHLANTLSTKMSHKVVCVSFQETQLDLFIHWLDIMAYR